MRRDDFRDDLEPTRGQWRHIAQATLRLTGEPPPTTRLAATTLLARLAAAEAGAADATADPAPELGGRTR